MPAFEVYESAIKRNIFVPASVYSSICDRPSITQCLLRTMSLKGRSAAPYKVADTGEAVLAFCVGIAPSRCIHAD